MASQKGSVITNHFVFDGLPLLSASSPQADGEDDAAEPRLRGGRCPPVGVRRPDGHRRGAEGGTHPPLRVGEVGVQTPPWARFRLRLEFRTLGVRACWDRILTL